MFESLQENLSSAIRSLRGRGKLTESNMREGIALIRRALLEADVSLPVANEFTERVAEQAVGEKVLKSLDPSEQLIGIVHQELVNLMGPVDPSLHLKPGLTILMLCGLQGSGKTTTCGKLGRTILKNGRKPMLVAADLQRPAAIHQLQVLGEQIGIPVYADMDATNPVSLCHEAAKKAKASDCDVLILDTAGRLHVDDELMKQLTKIERRVGPDQVYLVVDGMTGQDAVNSAKAFQDALELDGVIMTKLDGDARGGAALSVKKITNVPIKFIGTGEHLDELDEFSPERMAGRILGMGDIVGLAKKAQEEFDEAEMEKQRKRLMDGDFTLDDFKDLFGKARKLGPLNKIMSMMPGMGGMADALNDVDAEKDMKRLVGIIDSMTPDERRNPKKSVDQSRRRRIAEGAGVQPHEVNELVKQFEPIRDIMQKVSGMGMRGQMQAMREISQQGLNPNAQLEKVKKGSGKRLTPQERKKLKKLKEKELRKKKRDKKNKKRKQTK